LTLQSVHPFSTVAASVDFAVGSSLLTISVVHAVKPNTLTTNKADKRTLKRLIFTISFRLIIGLCSNRLKINLNIPRKGSGFLFCLNEKFPDRKPVINDVNAAFHPDNRMFQVFIPKKPASLTCHRQPIKLCADQSRSSKPFGFFLVSGN